MEATVPIPDPSARAPDGPNAMRSGRLSTAPGWVTVAVVVVALVPIVVATARALRDGWVPVGDDAFFGIRARDVFSGSTPLLGTWTSASLTVGRNVNNPGPLLFDLLAVPVGLFGTVDGVAIGVALLNGASIVGVAWCAHRRGGPLLSIAATMVAAALAWSMGSELLFDPWQPHALLLPFLWFAMLAWATSCGDLWLLPWLVGIGSLLVQTHLTYAYLVPALGVWAVVGAVLAVRGEHREGAPWAQVRRRAGAVVAVSAIVLVVSWAQPVVEELTGDGTGNLTRLVQTIGEDAGPVVGYRRAPRLMATVLTRPPFWLRPSLSDALSTVERVPGTGVDSVALDGLPRLPLSALLLVGLLAVLGLCLWDARRRGDRLAARAVVTSLVGLAVGLYTAARIPVAVFGIAPHQFRWLWPLGAFVTFAIVVSAARHVVERSPARARALVAAFGALTVLVAVLNLPKTDGSAGPALDAWAIPVIRDLDRQMGGVRGDGPLLYDFSEIRFAEPYSTPIMAELQRRGVPFVVDDAGLARQLGPERRFDGTNARNRVFYRLGDDALRTPAGARVVARHDGLTRREERELARLQQEIAVEIVAGRLRLNQRGRDLARRGELGTLPDLVDARDAAGLFESRALVRAVVEGLLDVDPSWRARYERYAQLQSRWDRETVSVYVAPL